MPTLAAAVPDSTVCVCARVYTRRERERESLRRGGESRRTKERTRRSHESRRREKERKTDKDGEKASHLRYVVRARACVRSVSLEKLRNAVSTTHDTILDSLRARDVSRSKTREVVGGNEASTVRQSLSLVDVLARDATGTHENRER